MSKRARHQPGFYVTLLNDECDRACNLKYRPKEKPSVMGVYEVKRIVAKQVRGGEAEYFIQWQNYSPSKNTWEPAEHLSEDLIALFENRSVDPLRADEYRERLALLFEKGLKSPTACHETVTTRHDVLRAMFPGLPSDLHGSPYLVNEEELIAAGIGSSLKKCLTVTGGGCRVNTPINLKLFLGKSLSFLDEQGRKIASCPVEKVQIKFSKSYFGGCVQ